MNNNIRVTVWNEYLHEVENPEIGVIYPKGIHGTIAEFLGQEAGLKVARCFGVVAATVGSGEKSFTLDLATKPMASLA